MMDDNEVVMKTTPIANKEYVLSRIISAHHSDVKSVVVSDSGMIFSGSRDESVKAFSSANEWSEQFSIKQAEKLTVNAVAVFCSPSGNLSIFVGRKDGSIAIFGSGSTEPFQILREHKLNVCTLYVDPRTEKLMSGSWDGNAIVWPISDLLNLSSFRTLCLTGHKMSVWAVSTVPDRPDFYLTGSADMTIKFWKDDVEVNSFSGHEDVVRSLVVFSSHRFLSAANDFTIRLWDLDAAVCLKKYCSLTGEYIYSMTEASLLGCRFVVNVCEGGFIECWEMDDAGELSHKQLIQTPTQSLWSVAALKNGDIVVGADNGLIYVFTMNVGRKASSEVLAHFESEVAQRVAVIEEARAAQQREIVKIKVALDDGQPDMELRYKKGSDPAEAAETFIRENNIPVSYFDEIVEYIKTNIPEARHAGNQRLSGPRPTKRVVVDGREWDYVFDVTTEDGRVLKLPYNVGEDTNWAAQRFVEKNNLPIQFLQKVSTLLKMQIPGATAAADEPFNDPFTEGRYVPGTSSGEFGAPDPFTGSGRYMPSAGGGTNSSLPAGFVDPLTGGSAYVLGSSTASYVPNSNLPHDRKRPRGELVPLREFFRFGIEHASSKAVLKLKELNEAQVEHRLTDEQLKALEDVMTSSVYEVRDVHISALDTGLCWNIDAIVPILDAFRLALLNRRLNRIYCAMRPEEGRLSRGSDTLRRLNAFLLSAHSDPVRILVCRAIANAAVHQWGREMLMDDIKTNISSVVAQLISSKAAVQLGATSALANWALLLLQNTEEGGITEIGPREDALRAVIQGLEKTESFSHFVETAQIRLLQAVVTLMWGDATVIRLAKGRNICSIVNRIKDAVTDEAGKAIARDIIEMTYAV